MRIPLQIGSRLTRATLVVALVAGTAATASAATSALVPTWRALLGCWEPVATARDSVPDSSRSHLVCVVPVDGGSAVDMVTVVDGKVVERERVDASGIRQPLTRDDCSGWQSAEWSSTGQRVYLRSELICDGGLKRVSTGVISMPSTTEWLDVQSVGVGERKAVRALRYREARSTAEIPADILAALGARSFSLGAARLAAVTQVTPADLIDVSRHLDAGAIEVWLVEHELGFAADASQLVQFVDAGVPTSVIDMVVALSYPDRFRVAAQPRPDRVGPGSFDRPRYIGAGGGGVYDPFWDPYYGSRYDRRYYSPYGYSQYGSQYGYDSGWYPNQRPVIIVVAPSDPDITPGATAPRGGGRVVNGRGYTRRPDPPAAPDVERIRPVERDDSRGSSSGSSGSTGSSGSDEGRTAKKRPPPAG